MFQKMPEHMLESCQKDMPEGKPEDRSERM